MGDGEVDAADLPNEDALGLSLSDVEFGLAFFGAKPDQAEDLLGLKWIGLNASAGAVELVGIPQLTASFKNLNVVINQVSGVADGLDANSLVVDFQQTPLSVVTGTDTSLELNMDGTLGRIDPGEWRG